MPLKYSFNSLNQITKKRYNSQITNYIRQDAAYDIRLYDSLGNLLRQATATGGKIEFNVTNLPNGIYYLHIYDGVNEKPEMRQIVVQH